MSHAIPSRPRPRVLRVRFTVRQLMIVVAVGAVLLAAIRPGQRFLYCMREADRYRGEQAACLAHIKRIEIVAAKRGITLHEIERKARERAEIARRTGEFVCGTGTLGSYQRFLEMAIRDERAYRRAAFHPWEPMPHSQDVQALERLLHPQADRVATHE